MKKLLAVLLSLVMVVSLFAACNQNTPATTTKPAATNPPATSGKPATTASTAAPTTTQKEPVTLVVAIPQSANIEDYENNALTQWLEEQIGCSIDVMKLQSSASDYKAQISTMLVDTSGNVQLPDIYWGTELGNQLYTQYGEDGYLMDMRPFFEDAEKAAVWNERMGILKEYDANYYDHILREMTAADGSMYVFPTVEVSYGDTIKSRVFINQDWLTKLNLPMPNDVESFYNTLVAFRDQDPNGNGIKDEIPLMGRQGSNGYPVDWLTCMFIYCDSKFWFNLDDNKQVYLPHVTDEYREAMIFINKLIKEGLMPESVFSAKSAELKGLVNVDDPAKQTIGVMVHHPTTVFTTDSTGLKSFVAMPYFSGVVRLPYSHQMNIHMSATTEHPDEAWALLMALFSWDGSVRARNGEFGVNWTYADPNTFSSGGVPATIKRIGDDIFPTVNNKLWGDCKGTSMFYEIDVVTQFDPPSVSAEQNYRNNLGRQNVAYAKEGLKNNPKYIFPELFYSQEQNDLTSDIRTNCGDFIKAVRANFCAGTGEYNDPSDDAQWTKYIDELNKMGLSTWIKQTQQMYNEQFGS